MVLILVLGGVGFYSLGADASDGITTKDKMDLNLLLRKYNGQSLYEKKFAVSSSVLDYKIKLGRSNGIIRAYATSFGNPGNDGESRHFKDGTRVRRGIVAVALPDESAIGKWVYVRRADKVMGGKPDNRGRCNFLAGEEGTISNFLRPDLVPRLRELLKKLC